MASISVTISIEGDPEESMVPLRRIAGVDGGQQAAVTVVSQRAEAEPVREPEPAVSEPSGTPAPMPSRYQRLWENDAREREHRQPAAEPPPTPAQWDSRLCNELVNNMTDAARGRVGCWQLRERTALPANR